jgi:hypothetical protein
MSVRTNTSRNTHLPPDIWYKIYRDHLTSAKDVFNLAQTCPTLRETLYAQIFIIGVLSYKRQ